MRTVKLQGTMLIATVVVALAGCERSAPPLEADLATAGEGAQLARAAQADESAGHPVFASSLHGNPRPLVGAAGAIRGLNAGGLPWVIDPLSWARVDRDGEVRVVVRGLVIDPTDPAAIAAGVAGRNPAAAFRAVLSCLTPSNGAVATVNVMTAPSPATPQGDARIRDRLSGIPEPCLAPIVFVTNPAGSAWFAVSGF